ncbi:MAG: Holliday junction ATP-dependent DNA helicase RuvB [Phycisphaeraceae bacterium]|nr:MAG: Holliday junction ATP-dependent DNA helicase RuvB [Phycisphaeraceae bacterium]
MAAERLISPTETPEESRVNWALRPESFDEYVGQGELIERLSISVQAVAERKAAGDAIGGAHLEHLLLHGPPGLGKTTLAHVVARELGTRVHTTSGPALGKGTDLVSALTRLGPGDVLFIDEIHRLPAPVEEFIYPAMEDFRIDVCLDSGLNARTVQIKCEPFTLIGATTRAGLLSAPLRSRFGLVHHLRYYEVDDLFSIVERSAGLMGIGPADDNAVEIIAKRSRGTPRIANRLLRRVRDYAQVKANGQISALVVEDALALEGVDHLGLDELDRTYLRIIATTYKGGPVGLETVAATMNEDSGTLEDVVEPYLLQIGFLARTRRGRALTAAAADHLGIRLEIKPIVTSEASLF